MMRLLYILILIGPMILGNTLIAATITPSLEHRLADIREGDRIPVIVYFDEQVDLGRFTGGRATAGEMIVALQETAARSQARVLAHLHAFGLEAEVRSFWINNSIAFEATRPLLETLAGFSAGFSNRGVSSPFRTCNPFSVMFSTLKSPTFRR